MAQLPLPLPLHLTLHQMRLDEFLRDVQSHGLLFKQMSARSETQLA